MAEGRAARSKTPADLVGDAGGDGASLDAGPSPDHLQRQGGSVLKNMLGPDRQARAREDYTRTRAKELPQAQHNAARIRYLRDAADSGLDALAKLFEDDQIIDDGSVSGRLRAVLFAMEERKGPISAIGLEFGVTVGDSGFRGRPDPVASDGGFRDPHLSSANQGSHFLTAVGLGFAPAEVGINSPMQERLLLGASSGSSDRDVAMRMGIGHEKAADALPLDSTFPGVGSVNAMAMFMRNREQYAAATAKDVYQFERALEEYDQNPAGLESPDSPLMQIAVDPKLAGNSYQDLRLTLVGWSLGEKIARGEFAQRKDVALWIRRRLGPAEGPSDDAHLADEDLQRLINEGRMLEFLERPRGTREQRRVLQSLAHSRHADAIATFVDRLDVEQQKLFRSARSGASIE